MRSILLLLLISFCNHSLGNIQHEKRQTSLDMSSILSEASALTAAVPAGSTTYSIPYVTPGGNLLQPPASLVGAIITAVPASILSELLQPSARSSIASEFRAGNTPMWYQTLPPAVKGYIESLNTQIAGGKVDLSATPSSLSFPAETSAARVTGLNGKVATSTSKALAAKATSGVSVGVAAVVGFLGVAIAL